MRSETSGQLALPLGYCAVCTRDVLTYMGLEDDDPRCCVHCDTPISEDVLRAGAEADLAEIGYGEIAPAKSCGSGGCGSGGCGR